MSCSAMLAMHAGSGPPLMLTVLLLVLLRVMATILSH